MIILACALLHNFIRTSMSRDPLEDVEANIYLGDDERGIHLVESIESSTAWHNFRDNLAEEMYRAWTGV